MSFRRDGSRGRQRPAGVSTPFPTRQLFILALCRICEPIAFMSIFPYIYYMISSFEITSDDRQIAIYAGLVTSAFAFAEFSTGVLWGRLSDRIGRKPVLLGGLAGTALSMLIFGFSRSLPVALFGRALGGLLNGNIGVLQTTVAEMITVKEHQPRAYSIMPFVWCLGSILGPALGGALAQPCLGYPTIFPRGGLFDRYPFLLPNLVCTVILACGVTIGTLFLEETHAGKKNRRDPGLEVGRWIVGRVMPKTRAPTPVFSHKASEAMHEEDEYLVDDDPPPGYRTTEGSPKASLSRTHSPTKAEKETGERNQSTTRGRTRTRTSRPCGAQKAFTRQVVLTIVSYGLLAYHTISFDQLMPVFLSSPVSHEPASSPFKFTGGFALSTKTIGIMLSFQGVYSMLAQIFLFPYVVKRFGALATFRFTIAVWPLLYYLVPYLVLLPPSIQMPGIFLCLLWRMTAQVLAYPSNAIILTNSAPSNTVLGLINGVAASTASLSRAFGPTISGTIHSWGLNLGYAGFAWWASGLVCILGTVESLWMKEGPGRMDEMEGSEEGDEEEEAGLIDLSAVEAALTAVSKSSENLPALAPQDD